MPQNNQLRFDLQVIASWIKPGSTIIGLGCGDGELLEYLKKKKQVKETGIELIEEKVVRCIEKGLSVIQGDINEEVQDYPDEAFDYVILSQTLQQVYDPLTLIRAMLRIGKKAIVSFPNFGHWHIRTQVLLSGHAPVTPQLPYTWYGTPNIRILSIKDFRRFAEEYGFSIFKEVAINTDKEDKSGRIVGMLPNLLATYGIFLIGKRYPA